MRIAILLLAAGSSSRMGVPKQLLPIGETTLLGIAIETALQCNATKVYCVLGANAEIIEESILRYPIETIFNPNYKTGLSSSIVTGIEHIKTQPIDAVLIILGDQPLIKVDYLNEMIATYAKNKGNIIATTYTDTFGVPAIIPKIYYSQLLNLKGDKGAKNFMTSNATTIIPLENVNALDIDTKKEYRDYLNSINFE